MSAFLTKPGLGKAFSNEIRAIAAKNRALIDGDAMEELKEAFALFDTNHSGDIDLRELKAAIRALGYPVTKAQCIAHFKECHKEPHQSLNFDDFCKIMGPKMNNRDTKEEIYKVF